MLNQLLRQCKCSRIGLRITERSSISKHRSIKTGGDLRSYGHAGGDAQAKNHLSGGAGAGINPIHMRKWPGAMVVINVDEEMLLQSLDVGAVHAIAFQQDGS